MQKKDRFTLAAFVAAFLVLALSATGAVAAGAAKSSADSYRVDPDHTYVMFRVKHVNIGYSYGRFNNASGSFTIDDAAPEKSRIEIKVAAADVDTNVDKRDRHIRSPDFLNVAKFSAITFRSTAVERIDAENYEVTGEVTLLGVTRPVTAKVRQTGMGKDPWGNFRRGFETSFTIRRSQWGMDFMLSGVSDAVDLTVSVEGIRQ